MQILYAQQKSSDQSISAAEKELRHSLDKTYQLYLLLFNLLRNFKIRADIRYEYLKTLPILEKSESNTVAAIASNPFFNALIESEKLSKAIENHPSSWDENDQFTASLFQQFIKSEFFDSFFAGENTFNAGKKLATKYLKEQLMADDNFHNALEELDVYWNDDIAFILPMVEKTIRKCNEEDESGIQILPLFSQLEDEEFVMKLLRKSIVNFNKYDDKIKSLAKGWEFDRMPEMDLLILRMAIVEAVEFESIPTKVSINEYIDLAKFYSSNKSRVFINAILDKIYKDFTQEGTIKKNGRGLIE